MKSLKLILTITGGLLFTLSAWGNTANPYNAETAPQHIQQCDSAPNNMQYFCSRNTDLELAQQQQGLAGMFNSGDQGAGQRARDAETNAQYSRASLSRVREDCRAAFDQCNQVCTDEANQLRQQAASAPDPGTANELNQQANQKLDTRGQCQQEQQTLETQAAAMDANLADILAAVAAILQQLGIGQGDGSASLAAETEDEDECNGEYAHLLIECNEQSGPSGTRAGLSGVAALNGRTSSGAGDLFDGAQSGEPGGEASDSDSGSGGSSPFSASGLAGGTGFSGSSGGSAGGDGSGKEDLDTNINQGYMGAGSGFSGGGGGGGSRGSGGRYNPAGLIGDKGLNKAELQKKLNKYSKDSSRSPASLGGANGPFDDNWAIINKAYKKNSSSMFHQQ